MKVEIKKLDACKRELTIEVEKERVIQKFDEVYSRIGKEIRIKGFRPGHIPRSILERDYRDLASQEVLKELLPQICKEVIEDNKLSVIDLPQISDIFLDKESLSFKATCEVKPEIKVTGYKKIKINYRKIEISDSEVKRVIQVLKEERNITDEPISDDFARRFGYFNFKELEEAIRMSLYLEKQSILRRSLEDQIIQKLLRENNFSLPSSLVNKRLEELVEREKFNLALRGVEDEQIKSKEKDLREKLISLAEEQVRIYLILERIAIQENFILDENTPRNVMEFLLKEAEWEVEG